MMRYVLRNTDEVMHVWANQIQSEGRCGNVSFQGRNLYSYRAKIAEIVEHEGRTYAVHTGQKWSVTTSSHQTAASYASNHLSNLRLVRFESDASRLKAETETEVIETLKKADRARNPENKVWHQRRALDLVEHFNKYMEINDRLERINSFNVGDLHASIAQFRIQMREREERERAKQLAEAAEGIQRWREHKQARCPRTPKPLLRVHLDPETFKQSIETSWGAYIGHEDALRLWPLIQRARRGERDYEVGMDVGVYRLTKIRRDGSLIVGCHDIDYVEIEGIAKELGLLQEETTA